MNSKVSLLIIICLGVAAGGEALYINTLQGRIADQRITLSEYEAMQRYNESILAELEDVYSEFETIASDYSTLQGDYASLQGEHESTQEELSDLEEEDAMIQDAYQSLQQNHSSLEEEHENLQVEYEALSIGESEIQTEYEEYRQFVQNTVETVNRRLGRDEGQQYFVTPDDPSVGSLLVDIVGGPGDAKTVSAQWLDIRRIYDWVNYNIHYSQDSPYPHIYAEPEGHFHWHLDCFNFPNETIASRGGDCEDHALLLLSLLLNYNYTEQYWCIRYRSDTSDHMAVAISVPGGDLVILDPSGNYYSGYSVGSMVFDSAEDAVDAWFTAWGQSNMWVTGAFNDRFYEEFTSNEEFYDWFHAKYP